VLTKLRSSLTYANVVSTLCLFIVLGGTSYAVATGSIDSREIRNNTIRSKDVRNRALLAEDFKAGQLPAGAQGPQGAQGSTGARGAQGVTGARGTALAYGLVSANGVISRRTSNATVTKAGLGIYCISVTGASDNSRPIILSPDSAQNDTEIATATIVNDPDPLQSPFISPAGESIVEWDSAGSGGNCSSDRWTVRTYLYRINKTDDTLSIAANDEGFSFAVP